jgi:hypothetical protein
MVSGKARTSRYQSNSNSRAILQKYVNRYVWFIFNVTFISFIQSILLFAFSCVPAYTILLSSQFDRDITTGDKAFFFPGSRSGCERVV